MSESKTKPKPSAEALLKIEKEDISILRLHEQIASGEHAGEAFTFNVNADYKMFYVDVGGARYTVKTSDLVLAILKARKVMLK